MSHQIFTQVQNKRPTRSRFDLSHDLKTSFKMGLLVPTLVLDTVPGDSFRISNESLTRFMPLIAPIMHRVNLKTYLFFVPHRLVWKDFPEWIVGNKDTPAPVCQSVNLAEGSLGDYIGLPILDKDKELDVTPMVIASYVKIYDEYFRDQNLEEELFVPVASGDNNSYYTSVLPIEPFKIAWRHDYFTSALPFPQKGDTVTIPLVQDGNLTVDYLGRQIDGAEGNPRFGHLDIPSTPSGNIGQSTGPIRIRADMNAEPVGYDPRGTLGVNVNASATDIETLRRAIRLQEWLEKNARGGTRYIESVKVHFGVRSSDARLQRPEFIGSVSHVMSISEVLSNAQTNSSETGEIVNPVGNFAGHGISTSRSSSFKVFTEEHGFIIGLTCAVPDTSYSQGVEKMFTRFDRLEYLWPTFAHLGEQPIRNKELYAQGEDVDEETFGYLPIYTEYRFKSNRVSGYMRDTLDHWHMARKFDNLPLLNSNFIRANPTTRIFTVEDDKYHQILSHIFWNIKASRPLPRFGTPSL